MSKIKYMMALCLLLNVAMFVNCANAGFFRDVGRKSGEYYRTGVDYYNDNKDEFKAKATEYVERSKNAIVETAKDTAAYIDANKGKWKE